MKIPYFLLEHHGSFDMGSALGAVLGSKRELCSGASNNTYDMVPSTHVHIWWYTIPSTYTCICLPDTPLPPHCSWTISVVEQSAAQLAGSRTVLPSPWGYMGITLGNHVCSTDRVFAWLAKFHKQNRDANTNHPKSSPRHEPPKHRATSP